MMQNSSSGPVRFKCPACGEPVLYDPDDPMNRTSGAMLRKRPHDPQSNSADPSAVVYLTCRNNHVRRYTVPA